MKLGAGWLSPYEPRDIPVTYHDVFVPRVSVGSKHDSPGAIFGTRIEEYGWVATQLEHWGRGKLLDAGAGFNPEIHVMSYIAASMGYDVTAVDADASALTDMPAHAGVTRRIGDICLLSDADETYDIYICVSVLEHMMEAEKALIMHEAHRVLKPGGVLLLTTDETEPAAVNDLLATTFLTGPVEPNGGPMLTPRVAYATAMKKP